MKGGVSILGLMCRSSALILIVVVSCLVGLAEMDRGGAGAGKGLRTVRHYWVDAFPFLPILGVANSLNRLTAKQVAPVLDVDYHFPAGRRIEAAAAGIREEALRLLSHYDELKAFSEIDEENYGTIDPQRKWKVFVLKWYNDWVEENTRWAPKTRAAMEGIDDVHIVMFSILPPGLGIPPHTGPYCGSVRYHLGLVIPQDGDVFISVDGEKVRWKEGKGILIDDTYEHYVVNNSTGYRIVLFMDVVRKVENPLVYKVNEFIANNPIIRQFFAHYNKKTELQREMCCGEGCDPAITFCPDV
eukprot:Hpha_TRINITY_DN16011_c5_g1::TRINITY_DN16011_c5_g1_i1::g.119642::m.119642/K12979/lpxO; beta-hydroxylase